MSLVWQRERRRTSAVYEEVMRKGALPKKLSCQHNSLCPSEGNVCNSQGAEVADNVTLE